MNTLFQSVELFFGAILIASLMSTVLAAVVWAVFHVFGKRIGAVLGLCLLLLVMIRLIPLPGPASPLSLWNLLPGQTSGDLATRTQIQITHDQATAKLPEEDESPNGIATGKVVTTVSSPTRFNLASFAWHSAVFAWISGLTIFVVRIWFQSRSLKQVVRRASPAPAELQQIMCEALQRLNIRTAFRLLESREIVSPLISGWLNPVILVPSRCRDELDTKQMQWVLAHELLHYRRKDLLTLFVCLALRSIHWFNPVVWITVARIRDLQEIACDAQVMKVFRNETPAISKHYGQVILTIAQWYNSSCKDGFQLSGIAPGIAFLDDHSRLTERILMLTKKPVFSPVRLVVSGVLVLAIVAGGFTAAQDPATTSSANSSPKVIADNTVQTASHTAEANGDDPAGRSLKLEVQILRGKRDDVRKLFADTDTAIPDTVGYGGSMIVDEKASEKIVERSRNLNVELISSPTVVTTVGQVAQITIGCEFPDLKKEAASCIPDGTTNIYPAFSSLDISFRSRVSQDDDSVIVCRPVIKAANWRDRAVNGEAAAKLGPNEPRYVEYSALALQSSFIPKPGSCYVFLLETENCFPFNSVDSKVETGPEEPEQTISERLPSLPRPVIDKIMGGKNQGLKKTVIQPPGYITAVIVKSVEIDGN